jgi:hypothetical protein
MRKAEEVGYGVILVSNEVIVRGNGNELEGWLGSSFQSMPLSPSLNVLL